MECNKEEALRAKQVAETRMQSDDFAGALRIAQKAQRLYPQLENIAQLLAVCEVHCSAEKKLGSETDWYAVLQIETSADETTIKKQYRKLALLLHPDKNKFSGSEAAFKLIGEANRILADRGKRCLYEIKRKDSVSVAKQRPTVQQSTQNPSISRHVKTNNKLGSASNSQFPDGSHHQVEEPFWAMCPLCKLKYHYLGKFLHKAMLCQNCKKPFIAFKLGTSGGTNWSQRASTDQKDVPNGGSSKDDHHGRNYPSKSKCDTTGGDVCGSSKDDHHGRNYPSKTKRDTGGDGCSKMQAGANVHMHDKSDINGHGMPKAVPMKVKPEDKNDNLRSGSRKRGRKCPTEPDATSEGIDIKSCAESAGNSTRRSSRQKQSVSYDENWYENDGFASKKSTANTASHAATEYKIKQEPADVSVYAAEESGKFRPGVDSTSRSDGSPQDSKVLEYPDPEFSDFDKEKTASCFAAGQVWACYDAVDGMPRFYAKVVKMLSSPGFRLRYNWFEPNPDDEDETLWSDADLPIACGKYVRGKYEETTDILMFSHQMHLISGVRRGSYLVYPRKGETWALFKNWDIKLSSEPEKHTFEFESLEILSDFDKETGISVAPLVRVKGFVSLFMRVDKDLSFQISRSDLYRFSHRIPSFKLTGKEKKGVPAGSFEFDPAALPANAAVAGAAEHVIHSENVVRRPMTNSKRRVEPPRNPAKENGVGAEHRVRGGPPRGKQEKILRGNASVRQVQSNKHKDTVTEEGAQKPVVCEVGVELRVRGPPRGQEEIPRGEAPVREVQSNKHKDTVMEDAQKSVVCCGVAVERPARGLPRGQEKIPRANASVRQVQSNKRKDTAVGDAQKHGVRVEDCLGRSPRGGQEKIPMSDAAVRQVQSNKKHKDTAVGDSQKRGTSTSKGNEFPPSKVGSSSNKSVSTMKKLERKNFKDVSAVRRSPRGLQRSRLL